MRYSHNGEQIRITLDTTHREEAIKRAEELRNRPVVSKKTGQVRGGKTELERARTKPYGYSIFQLDNMTMLCHVLSTTEDNLWAYHTKDGKGITKAIVYLNPFLAENRSGSSNLTSTHGTVGRFANPISSLVAWPLASTITSISGKSSPLIPPIPRCSGTSASRSPSFG